MEELIKTLTFNSGRIMVTGIPSQQITEIHNNLIRKGFTNCYIVLQKSPLSALRHKDNCTVLVVAGVDTTNVKSCFLSVPFNN